MIALSLAISLLLSNPSAQTIEVHTTAYCPCSICCGIYADGNTSTGELAIEGKTVAADPKTFPIGTILYIEGIGVRTVQDVGGTINENDIDIFYDTHNEAVIYGVKDVEAVILFDPTEEQKQRAAPKKEEFVIDYDFMFAGFQRRYTQAQTFDIDYDILYYTIKRKKKGLISNGKILV